MREEINESIIETDDTLRYVSLFHCFCVSSATCFFFRNRMSDSLLTTCNNVITDSSIFSWDRSVVVMKSLKSVIMAPFFFSFANRIMRRSKFSICDLQLSSLSLALRTSSFSAIDLSLSSLAAMTVARPDSASLSLILFSLS